MNLTSIPPGAKDPTDVVSRKVFFGRTELSGEIKLMQLSVIKSFNKISSARIVIQDGSASDRNFMLSNKEDFTPGKEVKIQLGYHGNVDTVFEGIVIKHAVKVRKGSSVLMIEAKDSTIKLTGTRVNAYFNEKSDKKVIELIAKDFKPEVEETTLVHKQLIQFEATNWDFICTRAEANGMLVLTHNGKLIVKKPAITSTICKALYGDNIYEFEAEMDARRHSESITGHSWNYPKQTGDKKKGKATLTETGNITSDDLGKVLGATVNLSHTGHLTEDQLEKWADAYVMRHKLSKAVGRVRLKGQADLLPGTTISLSGVGERFNGDVFVTGVLHQFDGTWKTDVQFGWKEEWFFQKEGVMEKPAAGLLPGVNGLQIGRVLKVDDTEGKQYRVKVHIPTFLNNDDGLWARVATLDAGPDRGVYFRPQEKDEVVLGFLNDDPREAIILGYLHSHDQMKSPLPSKDKTLEYGFVTHKKVKLIFDDTNKRMTLSVKTAKGEKSIILNNTSGTIELKDENKNIIKMNASGITIDAGPGNVIIKGANVLINS